MIDESRIDSLEQRLDVLERLIEAALDTDGIDAERDQLDPLEKQHLAFVEDIRKRREDTI